MPFKTEANSEINKIQNTWPWSSESGTAQSDALFDRWRRELLTVQERRCQQPSLVKGLVLTSEAVMRAIPLPSGNDLRAPPECADGREHKLTLESRLDRVSKMGPSLSETWLARADAEDCDGGPGGFVVAKIFCPSLFVPTKQPDINTSYILPSQAAAVEKAAYESLSSLQGRLLPYCLGYAQVALEYGERVDVLLLEYIPGKTLHQWREEHREENRETSVGSKWKNHLKGEGNYEDLHRQNVKWLMSIYAAVQEIHTAGISHGDLNGTNIILVENPQPNERTFVFVDFERSCDTEPYLNIMGKAVGGFICCDNHTNLLFQWCEETGFDEGWGYYFGTMEY